MDTPLSFDDETPSGDEGPGKAPRFGLGEAKEGGGDIPILRAKRHIRSPMGWYEPDCDTSIRAARLQLPLNSQRHPSTGSPISATNACVQYAVEKVAFRGHRSAGLEVRAITKVAIALVSTTMIDERGRPMTEGSCPISGR
jgi:hypothetical protein